MNLGGLAILAAMLVIFGIVVPYVMRRNQTDDDFGTTRPDEPGAPDGLDPAAASRSKPRSPRRKK